MGDIGRFRTYWQDTAPPRGNAAERSPESVAMVLRNARILQGYTLHEVATAINLRLSHLEAIEAGHFSDLPALVYARGFIGAYATFLELDRDELVNRFCDEVLHARSLPTEAPSLGQMPAVEDVAARRMPSGTLLAVAFVLAVLAYGLWRVAAPDNRAAALEVPPLPDRFQAGSATAGSAMAGAPTLAGTASTPTPVVPAPAAPASAVPVPPVPADLLIAVRALGDSWVQLRNTEGQRFASLVLHAGDVYVVPRDSAGMILSTGNLETLSITVNGAPVRLAAVPGRAQYHVALDPSRLLQGTAVQE